MPLTEATAAAEISDLMAKLLAAQATGDLNLQQALQDRMDFIQRTSGRAEIYGSARAITKGVKK